MDEKEEGGLSVAVGGDDERRRIMQLPGGPNVSVYFVKRG